MHRALTPEGRWSSFMTILRKVIFGFSILALGSLGRDAAAGSLSLLGHDKPPFVPEREELRNQRLYEHVVVLRARTPEEFDRQHLILGEFVSERPFFEYWVDRWEAHPVTFEHWNPWFWRIIDGGMLEGGPPVIPPLVSPPSRLGSFPSMSDTIPRRTRQALR